MEQEPLWEMQEMSCLAKVIMDIKLTKDKAENKDIVRSES
jgi:hypothetical protein